MSKAECARITEMTCELDWGKRLRAASREGASIPVPECVGIGVRMKDLVASQTIRQLQLLQWVVQARKKASSLKIKRPELSTSGPLAQLDLSVP